MAKSKATNKVLHSRFGQFPVLVQADIDGGYWVSCPVLEGCYSQGDTIDEALKNIEEAIALCLEETKKKKTYRPASVSFHMVTV